MPTKENQFNSLEDFGKHFGIDLPKKNQEENHLNETLFFGREKELLHLDKFIENSEKNIFGLYGVPMIGKSLLVKQFLKNNATIRNYSKLSIRLQNPENPETTIFKHIIGGKNISDLSFEQPTLIIIQNFEECLEWKGSLKQLHNIRVKYPLISVFLKKINQLPNVKLILESRFQINTPSLDIRLEMLPDVELKGVDKNYFRKLYKERGVTDEEFDAIAANFGNHPWLLSRAYYEMEWLSRKVLNKAQSVSITSYLWDLLEKIIQRLPKSDILLLCALILRNPIPYDDFEETFQNHAAFKNTLVFESVISLERKFLIQENKDNYEINPYLREVCFSFMKRKRSKEIKSLQSLPYFSTVQEPKYNLAKQLLDKGNYGQFYSQIHQLQRNEKFEEVHDVLNYALETDFVIKREGVLNEIGITFKKQKKYTEAIEILKEAIELGNIQSYNELAIIYKEKKEYNSAIDLLEQAIELGNIQSYNELAIIHKEKKEYDRAIQILEEALKKEPKNVRILNELAIIYKEKKAYDSAIDVLNKALGEEPQNIRVLNELSIVYNEKKEYDLALNIVERGLAIAPHDIYFKRTKNRILAAKNNKTFSRKKPSTSNAKRKLMNLLSDDKIKQFLKEYLKLVENTSQVDLQERLILQSSSFSEIENLKNEGVIDFKDYILKKAQIRVALLNLCKELD